MNASYCPSLSSCSCTASTAAVKSISYQRCLCRLPSRATSGNKHCGATGDWAPFRLHDYIPYRLWNPNMVLQGFCRLQIFLVSALHACQQHAILTPTEHKVAADQPICINLTAFAALSPPALAPMSCCLSLE